MKTATQSTLEKDILVRQSEMDRDKKEYNALIDRQDGRDFLLSSSFDCDQKELGAEHIDPQN